VSRAFLYVRLRYLLSLAGMWLYEWLFRAWVRLWLSWHYDCTALLVAAGCLVAYVLLMGWLLFSGWPFGR
jgi:hypothetical protein